MDDLISRQVLYERAATLEAQALDYVGKLNERDGEEYSTEWKIWSAILIERTAFKHDVFDAPSAEKHGRWIKENIVLTTNPVQYQWHCSECGMIKHWFTSEVLTNYCPNCGARMDEVEE